MRHVFLLALLALPLLLGGCPALYVDRGGIVTPSSSLTPPSVSALPGHGTYVERAEEWRRESRVGVGGHVAATLVDPSLAAAEVAHEGALQTASGAALASLLANRWQTYYGPERDRFPIAIEWRFDEQFARTGRVLDPADWRFELETSDGTRLAPVQVGLVEAGRTPESGYWEGSARVFFPWRRPDGRLTLGGHVSWAQLTLTHRSGSAMLTWRFRPAI